MPRTPPGHRYGSLHLFVSGVISRVEVGDAPGAYTVQLQHGFLITTGTVHRHAHRNDQDITGVVGLGQGRIECVAGGKVKRPTVIF